MSSDQYKFELTTFIDLLEEEAPSKIEFQAALEILMKLLQKFI